MAKQTGPFFSIVIPALNEEKYLPILLADLANQTCRDFEVIVIDGSSTDRTVEKCKELEGKLPELNILTSKVRNVSVQRNIGGVSAKGQYIVFNDADNRLPQYFLEGLIYQLHTNPIDLFTCWSISDTDKSNDKTIVTTFNMLLEASQLAGTPSAFGAMIGCKKSIYAKTGGFNPEIGFAEDTEFVRHAYKLGFSFKVFRDPRYVYSLRRFQKMGTVRMLQKSALLNLKYLTGQKVNQKIEYPMGGEHFEKRAKKDTSPDFFKTIQIKMKKWGGKRKIADRIKALLSLEETKF
jgi:glycosyltransferase involved in cell wall biosynthesis